MWVTTLASMSDYFCLYEWLLLPVWVTTLACMRTTLASMCDYSCLYDWLLPLTYTAASRGDSADHSRASRPKVTQPEDISMMTPSQRSSQYSSTSATAPSAPDFFSSEVTPKRLLKELFFFSFLIHDIPWSKFSCISSSHPSHYNLLTTCSA